MILVVSLFVFHLRLRLCICMRMGTVHLHVSIFLTLVSILFWNSLLSFLLDFSSDTMNLYCFGIPLSFVDGILIISRSVNRGPYQNRCFLVANFQFLTLVDLSQPSKTAFQSLDLGVYFLSTMGKHFSKGELSSFFAALIENLTL